jgi:glycosyltransferase involved in cell wall biosynthesis
MEKPLVSICCQTYNHANYIEDALEGFLMQVVDFKYEILLRDDASTDGTAEICKDYAKKYPDKIKLLGYKENQYKRGVRPFPDNVRRAKGKYVAFCEGDDYWTDPLKLQKQVDFLEKNKAYVVCSHNARIIDEKSNIIQNKKIPYFKEDKTFTQMDMKKGAPMLTLSLVFRNIIGFSEHIKKHPKVINGDSLLISFLGKFGKGYYIEDIQPAVYRVHSGGIWSLKKYNPLFVYNSHVNLYSALQNMHDEEVELVDYFEEKISNCHQNLLANMAKLTFKEMLYANLKYIKRNYPKPLKGIYNLIKYNGKYTWYKFLKKT